MSNFEIINKKIPGADIVAQIITDDLPAPYVPKESILLIERKPTASDGDIILVRDREKDEATICTLFNYRTNIKLKQAFEYSPEMYPGWASIAQIPYSEFDSKYEIIGIVFEIRTILNDEWKSDYGI